MGAVNICRDDEKVKTLESENRELRRKLKKSTANATPVKTQAGNGDNDNGDYEAKLETLKRELSSQNKETQRLRKEHEADLEEERKMEQKQKQLESVVTLLTNQLEQIKDKTTKIEQQTQKRMKKMQDEVEASHKQKEKLESQMQQMIEDMKKKENELINGVKLSSQEKEQLARELKQKTQQFQDKMKSKDKNISEMMSKIQKAQTEQERQTSQAESKRQKDLQIQLNQVYAELQRLRYSRSRATRSQTQVKYVNLFNVSLLVEQPDLKQFLTSVIESRYEKKIIKTKFLYQFDQLNKINVHRYIDYKYNLAVIVRLSNGNFVAAFSQGPFYQKMQSKYDGLLISLTNQKVFYLAQKNKKAIQYEDSSVIFGNSEFRLRNQEKRLYSNFGANNGYYDSRGEKVDVLLGAGPTTREMQIKGYEFYEVIFES